MPRNKKLLEEIKLALNTMPEETELPQTEEVKVQESPMDSIEIKKKHEGPRIGIDCQGCKKQTPDVDLIYDTCPGRGEGKTRNTVRSKCQVCGKNKFGFKPKDL